MGTIKEKLDKMLASKNAIKAAIIEKGQAVEDVLSSYPAAIKAIKTGTDTSDATVAAGDILSGKIAYGASGKLIGTIPSKGSGDLSASGANIIVPAGYYPSQVQKSVVTANQATPTISVSSGGLITASATQGAGYVAAGTKSGTKQLTTQAAKTITPTTTQQTAVASGRYTTGAVTIKGDANLKADNIKKGTSIFGVAGNYEGKEVIEYTYRDNITTTRESSKKLRINLPSSHPSSAELLHLWIMSTSRRNYISQIFFTRYGTMSGYAALDYIYFLVPTDNYYGNDVYTESSHSSSNTWLYLDGTSIIIDLNNTSGASDISFYTSGMNVLDTSILFVK